MQGYIRQNETPQQTSAAALNGAAITMNAQASALKSAIMNAKGIADGQTGAIVLKEIGRGNTSVDSLRKMRSLGGMTEEAEKALTLEEKMNNTKSKYGDEQRVFEEKEKSKRETNRLRSILNKKEDNNKFKNDSKLVGLEGEEEVRVDKEKTKGRNSTQRLRNSGMLANTNAKNSGDVEIEGLRKSRELEVAGLKSSGQINLEKERMKNPSYRGKGKTGSSRIKSGNKNLNQRKLNLSKETNSLHGSKKLKYSKYIGNMSNKEVEFMEIVSNGEAKAGWRLEYGDDSKIYIAKGDGTKHLLTEKNIDMLLK